MQAVPFGINMKATLPLDETYYKNCAPPMSCDENAKYRTINGSCNNLLNPLWGSTVTPYVRLVQANYEDGTLTEALKCVNILNNVMSIKLWY